MNASDLGAGKKVDYDALVKSSNANQNSTTMSSAMAEQVRNLNFESRGASTGGRGDVKDLKNFYNFDEDTPMKFRIYLFRQQFKEFSTLK